MKMKIHLRRIDLTDIWIGQIKFQNGKFALLNSLCYAEFLRYYYVSTILMKMTSNLWNLLMKY